MDQQFAITCLVWGAYVALCILSWEARAWLKSKTRLNEALARARLADVGLAD